MLPTKFAGALMAAIAAAGLAVSAVAQPRTPAPLEPTDMRLSDIVGINVKTAQGEELGAIQDLIIDRRTGKVDYVALQHRVGETLFAYPISALVAGDDGAVVLRNDPSYWDERAERAASASAGPSRAQPRQLVRASELLHKPSLDGAGTVKDLVVSLLEGRIRLAVAANGGEDRLVPASELFSAP